MGTYSNGVRMVTIYIHEVCALESLKDLNGCTSGEAK